MTTHDKINAEYEKTFPRKGIYVNSEGQEIPYKETWRFKFYTDPPEHSTRLFVDVKGNVVAMFGINSGESWKKKILGKNIFQVRKEIHNKLYKTICLKEFESVEGFKEICQENIKNFIADYKTYYQDHATVLAKYEKDIKEWTEIATEQGRLKAGKQPEYPTNPFYKYYEFLYGHARL